MKKHRRHGGESGGAPRKEQARGTRRKYQKTSSPTIFVFFEIIFIILLAVSVSLTLKTFLFESFIIPSASMETTLKINDRIAVDKLSMWFNKKPKRQDVVVFSDPGGWLTEQEATETNTPALTKIFKNVLNFLGMIPSSKEGFLVKRIIGVGGDTVQCCDNNNNIMVNGKALEENYLHFPDYSDSQHTLHAPITFKVKVPKHYLWVMGDNRYNSCDSLCHVNDISHGFVPENDIVGRVSYIIWPLSHFKKLDR
jgi:signal peptidase I